MKKYIAYLDLLGIKELILMQPMKYATAIYSFRNSILDACLSNNLSPDNFRVFFFSDCAFVESTDIRCLFDFMRSLRKDLFVNHALFFKAAIDVGVLSAQVFTGKKDEMEKLNSIEYGNAELRERLKSTGEKAVGILFDSADIASVYTNQSKLKGIGISVNHAVLQIDEDYRNSFDEYVCKSIYLTDLKDNTIVSYFDLKLDYQELGAEYFLKFIKLYFITNAKDQKLGRYYLSYLCNYINSANFENIDYNEDKHEFYLTSESSEANEIAAKIILDALLDKNQFLTFNRIYDKALGVESAYLILLDKIYFDKNNNNVGRVVIKKLLEVFNKVASKYLYNLNKIPTSLFEYRNKLLFLSDYEHVISDLSIEKPKVKRPAIEEFDESKIDKKKKGKI